jgi:dienelactone hydrolase
VIGSSSATGVYVFDLMRALDYLETRPEADLTRVGITGASGGGLATLWAFAADERFTCAAPVCFATSLEVEPHNGCPCNHVPGTLRLGDRADVLAVRAPAPVFVIGADDDPEFPAEGTRRTGDKLRSIYALFGAQASARAQVFRSRHDYNLEMVGAALGFFDQHLRGVGDGSPVALTPRATEPPAAPELICLLDVPAGVTTMREVAAARVRGGTTIGAEAFVALNGGRPPPVPSRCAATDRAGRPVALPSAPEEVRGEPDAPLFLTFESEPGLTVPAVLWLPADAPRAGVVLLNDEGKSRAAERFGVAGLVRAGFACLAVDARGLGELADLDLRLMIYLGTAPAFAAGIDATAAGKLMRAFCPQVGVAGAGPLAAHAVLCAGLIDPRLDFLVGMDSLRDFGDMFEEGVPLLAIQPCADRAGSLDALRAALAPRAEWSFRGDPAGDLGATLLRLLAR